MKFKNYALATVCMFTLLSMPTSISASTQNVPPAKIENTGNVEIEDKLNKEIQKNNRNEENEEEHFSIHTSFEEKYRDDEKISFVITTVETIASSSTKNLYYNTNLKTGEELTLKQLLGDNYQELANETIKEQIKQRMEKDENQIFFGFHPEDKELGIEGFTGIDENQTFYINQDGNVVITFEQFEIAPGYMGIPEFEIIKK